MDDINSSFPSPLPAPHERHKGALTRSLYIAMRDGTRLAVDLSLPRDPQPERSIPALFSATRYWRAPKIRAPFGWFYTPPDPARNFFTARGYALLRIDMRGTGASEGHQRHPWPASDLEDLYDLVEWAVRQPWCNGEVYGFGNSYLATTAEMLGACSHPAVRAALVRFNEFDVYTDIAFPGGVPNEFMLRAWARYNRALDANQPPPGLKGLERLLVAGVKPVNNQPVPAHDNRQVDSALLHVTFRDDRDPEMGVAIDEVSIHTRPTTHAIDHWGSWFDAATADAVIRRFASSPRPQRAVIGAWNHGARQQVGAETNPFPLRAQMAEALKFFAAPPASRRLHYYTVFEEVWKTTDVWPPQDIGPQRLYFAAGSGMMGEMPAEQSTACFEVDFTSTTGTSNRWQTELDGRPVRYAPIQAPLVFQTAPFESDSELTGYPLAHLWVRSSHADGAFFVYLEAVDEQGAAHYLSEGQLRAIHRAISTETAPYRQFTPYHSFKRADACPLIPGEPAELVIGLHPISALIRRGWRLKVSISGADRDTFARIPAEGTPVVEVLLGGKGGSWFEVPLKTRG